MKNIFYFLIILIFVTGCTVNLSDDETSNLSCGTSDIGQYGECATIEGNSFVGYWYEYNGTITLNDDNTTSYNEDKLTHTYEFYDNGNCRYMECSEITKSGCGSTNYECNWGVSNTRYLLIYDINTPDTSHKTYYYYEKQGKSLIFQDIYDNNKSYSLKLQ